MDNVTCVECTNIKNSIWSLLPKDFEDWHKYETAKKIDNTAFKITYLSNLFAFKILIPSLVNEAFSKGLIGEITIPMYIHKHGTEIMKKHTPRIIKFVKIKYQEQPTMGILEERAMGVDLDVYIDNNKYLKFNEVIEIAWQGFNYLKDLHAHKLAHRDIKPGNLLYYEYSKKLTFIDFGFACTTNCCRNKGDRSLYYEQCSGKKGTPMYVHPKIFENSENTLVDYYSYDVYAFALTLLYTMKDHEILFNNLNLNAAEYTQNDNMSLDDYKRVIAANISIFETDYSSNGENVCKFISLICSIIQSKGVLIDDTSSASEICHKLKPIYDNVKKIYIENYEHVETTPILSADTFTNLSNTNVDNLEETSDQTSIWKWLGF